MIKYLLIFVALIGLIWMFMPLVHEFSVLTNLNQLSSDYVVGTAKDLNMPNAVTAVVVTYRGLDTLGEVTVLFLATAGIGLFLKRRDNNVQKRRKATEVLNTASALLLPLMIMFGVYIFLHGHLTPGGGFQGGVVIASAFLLMIMADTSFGFSHGLIHFAESISGAAYVIMGVLGLLLIGFNSFLDPRYLPLGEWNKLFSSGAVPIIYSLIGLKVGSEMSSVIDSLQTDGGEE
jgi:multicomponent Na+:H+ antiporter subunit B